MPLIAPPDGLAAPVVKRDGFTLRWDNPDGAVSNRVEIFEVQPGKDDKGDSVEYDFSDFRNDTGNARDARKRAQRKAHVDLLQVVFRRAEHLQVFSVAGTAAGREEARA